MKEEDNKVEIDGLSIIELVELSKYYRERWKGVGSGCKPKGYYDEMEILSAIDERIRDLASGAKVSQSR